jgi:hypothetical protein
VALALAALAGGWGQRGWAGIPARVGFENRWQTANCRTQLAEATSAACLPTVRPAEHGLGGVATAVQHHGKEMSYNNYLDADAAYSTGGWVGWAPLG